MTKGISLFTLFLILYLFSTVFFFIPLFSLFFSWQHALGIHNAKLQRILRENYWHGSFCQSISTTAPIEPAHSMLRVTNTQNLLQLQLHASLFFLVMGSWSFASCWGGIKLTSQHPFASLITICGPLSRLICWIAVLFHRLWQTSHFQTCQWQHNQLLRKKTLFKNCINENDKIKKNNTSITDNLKR